MLSKLRYLRFGITETKIVAVLLLWAGLSIFPTMTWATGFPNAGVDEVLSLSKFKITFTRDFAFYLKESKGIPFCEGYSTAEKCPPSAREYTSPLLYDPNTKIGRSDPHQDGDETDMTGAKICEKGNSNSCATDGFLKDKVREALFQWHTTSYEDDGKPFDEGPKGMEEIHTQVISFKLTPSDNGDSSASAIRAGDQAPCQARSLGEVESLNGDGFPAESFFHMYVEFDVDLDNNGIVDMVLYNEAGIGSILDGDPLVFESTSLTSFPPEIIYSLTGLVAPKLYLRGENCQLDPAFSEHIGWLTIMNFGINIGAKLTVNKTGTGTGNVTGQYIDCNSDCTEETKVYVPNTQVSLTATAEAGFTFTGWSACSGTENCTITMDKNKTVTATFELPTVSSVSPPTATLGKSTIFKVQGSNLPDSTAFWIHQCEGVTLVNGGTTEQRQFQCTPSWSTGTKDGVVKNKSGGTVLRDFKVTVVEPPPTTGSIQITIEPAAARSAGAKWEAMIVGINWEGPYESGKTVSGFKTGDTPIRFTDISGWQTPAESSVAVVAGDTVTATATYLPITFPLNVNKVGNGTIEGGGIQCGNNCSGEYNQGTEIALIVTPDSGWKLKSWSGACSSTGDCFVTMNSSQNVTATFEIIPPNKTLTITTQGNGTVTRDPEGINCNPNCEYSHGSQVVLAPQPDTDYIFAGWKVGNDVNYCQGTGNCTVTMNNNQNVTATFDYSPNTFTLNVTKPSNGTVTSTPVGINCGTDGDTCSKEYTAGTQVTLIATPNSGWKLKSWGVCSSTETCVITLNADTNVVGITFEAIAKYILSVLKTGTGSGIVTGQNINCGRDCTKEYTENTPVTLEAKSDAGSIFMGWSGVNCVGTSTCTVIMNTAQNVTATFNLEPLPVLTVIKDGTGKGKVIGEGIDCGSDCTKTYTQNASVKLTAQAEIDSIFAGWNGISCRTGSCPTSMTVTMNETKTVTATFSAKPKYQLTVNTIGMGSVTGTGITCGNDCTEEYIVNTEVILTANADAGYIFEGWNGACNSTGNCTISMDQAKTVTATFVEEPKPKYKLTVNKIGTGSVTAQGLNCGSDCTEEYEANTSVLLTASPSNTFASWSGDCAGTDYYCQVPMTADKTVTATFIEAGNVVLLIVPASRTVSVGKTSEFLIQVQAENQPIDSITLELRFDPNFLSFEQLVKGNTLEQEFPTPSSHCESNQGCIGLSVGTFSAASGNFEVATIHFTPKQAGSTELYFTEANTEVLSAGQSVFKKSTETVTIGIIEEPKYQLTVNTIGMGKVTGEGIECGSDCIEEYLVNMQITLTAAAEVGNTFSGWSGAACHGTGNCIVPMTQNQEVTATFVGVPPPPILTISVVGTGTGRVTGKNLDCENNCTAEYAINTKISLTAELDANSQFMGWEGACSGITPSCQVTMNESKTVIAKFDEEPKYQLTVNKMGMGKVTGEGIECGSDCIEKYPANTQVILTADAEVGYIFSSWNGADCRDTGNCIVSMTQNQEVTAIFIEDNENESPEPTLCSTSGLITATCDAQGQTLTDVNLGRNISISNAVLEGNIVGDAEAPAWLKNVEVKENAHLSGVIISDTVILGKNVVLGEGVRFTNPRLIPTDTKLTDLLPTLLDNCPIPYLKRIDLLADVLEPPGEGILAAINTLPDIQDNHWEITQDFLYGYLQLTIDAIRFAEQPISVTSTNMLAGLEVLKQQSIHFVTDTGIKVLSHPAIQAPCTLQTGLADLNLPTARLQTNGNLHVPTGSRDESWFSARPDWLATEIEAGETGLFLMDSPHIPKLSLAYSIFTDNNGIQRQQFFHPAPAIPLEVLDDYVQNIVIEPYGLVSFKLGAQNYRGVIDYLVTKGTPPDTGTLQIESTTDANGDGMEDWVLIYHNGERQRLLVTPKN